MGHYQTLSSGSQRPAPSSLNEGVGYAALVFPIGSPGSNFLLGSSSGIVLDPPPMVFESCEKCLG